MEKSKKEIIEIAHSLDGTEMIYPFLPELLANFYELGAFTDEILEVLKTNNLNLAGAEVLDVACGKGAVGILLAQEFGCKVTGVDLMSSFIEDAMNTAQRRGVENLCRFVCSDVRKFDAGLFDLVIVASAGPIWGNWKKSAAALRGFVKEEGFLLIDDCVLKEDKFVYRDYPSRDRFINDITSSGYRLLAEKFVDDQKLIDLNNRYTALIKYRAKELAQKHPAQKELFIDYVKSQELECDHLEKYVHCAIWLFKNSG